MNETKQYCVVVKLYTWAVDEETAVEQVTSELSYLCELDNNLAGFIFPSIADVTEDKEP